MDNTENVDPLTQEVPSPKYGPSRTTMQDTAVTASHHDKPNAYHVNAQWNDSEGRRPLPPVPNPLPSQHLQPLRQAPVRHPLPVGPQSSYNRQYLEAPRHYHTPPPHDDQSRFYPTQTHLGEGYSPHVRYTVEHDGQHHYAPQYDGHQAPYGHHHYETANDQREHHESVNSQRDHHHVNGHHHRHGPVNIQNGMAMPSAPVHHDYPIAHNPYDAPLPSMPDSGGEAGYGRAMSEASTKPPKGGANSEVELRKLYQENQHRTLADVAGQLQGKPRDANTERNRQIFAMLWIGKTCKRGNTSVPRSTVYASYAHRCTVDQVSELNPASFGKLVRVIYPGLNTRRLGVRGESKYHYVDFEMDANSLDVPPNRFLSGASPSITTPRLPDTPERLPAADCPEPWNPPSSPGQAYPHPDDTHSIYQLPFLEPKHPFDAGPKTALGLYISPTGDDGGHTLHTIAIPAIDAFLPEGTNPYTSNALVSLYKNHCLAIADAARFCKGKQLLNLYASFPDSLSGPVKELFAHPKIARWLKFGDYAVYQHIMTYMTKLVLQVIPAPVRAALGLLSEKLVTHIQTVYKDYPQETINARQSPAAMFAHLLDRVLRVNSFAIDCATYVIKDGHLKELYHDWVKHVRIHKVAEVVPRSVMDDVAKLLVSQIRYLCVVNQKWTETEDGTMYADAPLISKTVCGDDSALERWREFVLDLPNTFSGCSHSEIISCVDRIGTAVLRDLTVADAPSFRHWWLMKSFVDELILFFGERGAFMRRGRAWCHEQIGATSVSTGVPVSNGPSTQAADVSNTQDITNTQTALGKRARQEPDDEEPNNNDEPTNKRPRRFTAINSSSELLSSRAQSAPMPISALPNVDNARCAATPGPLNPSVARNNKPVGSIEPVHDDSGIGSELDSRLSGISFGEDEGPVCGT